MRHTFRLGTNREQFCVLRAVKEYLPLQADFFNYILKEDTEDIRRVQNLEGSKMFFKPLDSIRVSGTEI